MDAAYWVLVSALVGSSIGLIGHLYTRKTGSEVNQLARERYERDKEQALEKRLQDFAADKERWYEKQISAAEEAIKRAEDRAKAAETELAAERSKHKTKH